MSYTLTPRGIHALVSFALFTQRIKKPFLFLLNSHHDMETAQHVTLSLADGQIRALSDGKVIRARGIRYAKAARFAKPSPVSWHDVVDCTGPACICPQNPSRLTCVTGDLEKGRPQSENCLHVSVAAPVSAKNAPVMVFFHGGAYITGGGDLDAYSPRRLADKGVVGVTVTHRLGMFGYMPMEGVAPANLGLLDQIEALKWVQRNITAFGGDKDNVTLFGQSAGADAIYCLLVAEETKGLFHRAVMQSAPIGRLDHDFHDALAKHAEEKLAGVDAATVDAARLLEVTVDIMKLSMGGFKSMLAFTPAFGEYPLPAASEHRKLFLEAATRVPLMMGHTANEETAFLHIDTAEDAKQRLAELFELSTDRLTSEMERVVKYKMEWYPEGSELMATHCIELALLLGDWEASKDAGMLKGSSREAVESLGDKVRDLWVAFARGEVLQGNYVIDEHFQGP